jgi:hypothetical protein
MSSVITATAKTSCYQINNKHAKHIDERHHNMMPGQYPCSTIKKIELFIFGMQAALMDDSCEIN